MPRAVTSNLLKTKAMLTWYENCLIETGACWHAQVKRPVFQYVPLVSNYKEEDYQ